MKVTFADGTAKIETGNLVFVPALGKVFTAEDVDGNRADHQEV